MAMPRYKLLIEYDGSAFVGWQRQDNGVGVQQVVEEAVLAFSGEAALVQCAGRTDAGVHAFGQVAHLDLEREWEAGRIRDALNAHLRSHAVSILTVEAVDGEFHARFSACERRYEYRILNRRAPPAIELGHVWWLPRVLDSDAMTLAAKELLGHHDFTTFRAVGCQARSPEKTLDQLDVVRMGEMIVVTARARSFLHHQVRNMVGTLTLVGDGKWGASDIAGALAARDRKAGGPTAPADGLYLVGVGY
jgi:tRNA pseudouridine38-40 synthase